MFIDNQLEIDTKEAQNTFQAQINASKDANSELDTKLICLQILKDDLENDLNSFKSDNLKLQQKTSITLFNEFILNDSFPFIICFRYFDCSN